jgi:hypothetical protein
VPGIRGGDVEFLHGNFVACAGSAEEDLTKSSSFTKRSVWVVLEGAIWQFNLGHVMRAGQGIRVDSQL